MERHNRDALNKSLMERAPGSSPGDSREVTNLAGLPLPLPEKIRLPALQQRLHLPLPLHGARGRFPGGDLRPLGGPGAAPGVGDPGVRASERTSRSRRASANGKGGSAE